MGAKSKLQSSLQRSRTCLSSHQSYVRRFQKWNNVPLVPIAILRAESDSTFALTCALVIAPREKAVEADRKTAA
jgi:hypothetical protein